MIIFQNFELMAVCFFMVTVGYVTSHKKFGKGPDCSVFSKTYL